MEKKKAGKAPRRKRGIHSYYEEEVRGNGNRIRSSGQRRSSTTSMIKKERAEKGKRVNLPLIK